MFSSQLLGAPMLTAQADAFLAAMHPNAAMSMNVTPQCSRFFSSYVDFTFHFFDCISQCMPTGFLQHLDASPEEEDSLMVPFFFFLQLLCWSKNLFQCSVVTISQLKNLIIFVTQDSWSLVAATDHDSAKGSPAIASSPDMQHTTGMEKSLDDVLTLLD
jgi:hypothetical protein